MPFYVANLGCISNKVCSLFYAKLWVISINVSNAKVILMLCTLQIALPPFLHLLLPLFLMHAYLFIFSSLCITVLLLLLPLLFISLIHDWTFLLIEFTLLISFKTSMLHLWCIACNLQIRKEISGKIKIVSK